MMLLDIFGLMLWNSFFCLGLFGATGWGDILEPVDKFLKKILVPEKVEGFRGWIYKGLIGCVKCMSTFWGFFFLLAITQINEFSYLIDWWFIFPIYSFSLSKLNEFLYLKLT